MSHWPQPVPFVSRRYEMNTDELIKGYEIIKKHPELRGCGGALVDLLVRETGVDSLEIYCKFFPEIKGITEDQLIDRSELW